MVAASGQILATESSSFEMRLAWEYLRHLRLWQWTTQYVNTIGVAILVTIRSKTVGKISTDTLSSEEIQGAAKR